MRIFDCAHFNAGCCLWCLLKMNHQPKHIEMNRNENTSTVRYTPKTIRGAGKNLSDENKIYGAKRRHENSQRNREQGRTAHTYTQRAKSAQKTLNKEKFL